MCSFETIIEKYGLTDPGLLRLARIVHAADIESDLHTDEVARAWKLSPSATVCASRRMPKT